jgi:hypothetical protein
VANKQNRVSPLDEAQMDADRILMLILIHKTEESDYQDFFAVVVVVIVIVVIINLCW